MVIGVDARFYGKAGPGRYIKNLLFQLQKVDTKNNYIVFLSKAGFSAFEPENPNFIKVEAGYSWYSFEEQFLFLFKLLKYKLAILYVPHFNIPVLYPGKIIAAIPDLIMNEYSTESASTLPKPYYWFKKLVYNLVILFSVIRVTKIIVPSMATFNDFCQKYPFMNKTKLKLAYEGFDEELLSHTDQDANTVLEKYKIKKPYLLYVGSMYEHKNLNRLLLAFKQVLAKLPELSLVIVGKKDYYSSKVFQEVQKLKLEDSIKLPGEAGFVTDSELYVLRKNACAYVFPSLKEGFSLTPLEALWFNLPCAISKIPCHEEIYEDACVFFDPKDVNDIADKILRVLSDESLREKTISNFSRLKDKYSFKETARITLDTFETS